MTEPDTEPVRISLHRLAAGFLLLLLISFAGLAPGGPIDNRDFSHLGESTFWGFNAFLVGLWLTGFISVPLLWHRGDSGLWLAISVSRAFIFIVALDLGRVFPLSPDPIGVPLGIIDILDGGWPAT